MKTPLFKRWLPTLVAMPSLLAVISPAPAALPLQPEQIVVTCFSGTINYYSSPPTATPNLTVNGYVVAQFDTQTGTIGPLIPLTTSPPAVWNGANSPPFSGFHNETGQRWNAQRLGEVFGIAVDDASPPNIYVTATEAYNVVGSTTPLPKGAGGAGGVYRLDGTTGASTSGSLPNNSVNGPGLGNVCYRRAGSGTGYLYVSNLEDGKIYRMDATSLTQVGSPFDHGVQGRPNQSLAQIVDDGTPGLTQFGRRVWGVQTYQNRLYYAVWWEDSRNISGSESNEIWRVDLDSNGGFVAATAQRLFGLPNFTVNQWSHPIASIDFSPAGTMFLAERYWQYLSLAPNATFGAHHTRVLRYTLSGPNWVTTPNTTHHVGGDASFYFANNLPGANSAGGVAVNCDESIWVTGDMYAGSYSTPPNVPFGSGDLGYVYGTLRIPIGGNSMYAGPGYGSFAIDYDGNTNSVAKFGVGAIATVRECCVPPPSGLAAWWPLDELTGATTYADLSGNGNTALVQSGGPVGNGGSPSATSGKVAGANFFYGPTVRGRALNAPSLNFGTTNFTMDCWVKPVPFAGGRQPIVDKLNQPTPFGYAVSILNGNVELRLGDGTLYTHIGPSVGFNTWNFIAVMVDRTANTVRFHVNGVTGSPQTLAPAGSFNSTVALLIGGSQAVNDPYGELAIDELELFNRVLTTNELNTLWLADSQGKCKTGQPPCTNSMVTIICPPNTNINCAPIVHYLPPQASTTCGTITNVSCSPPSGSMFPVGPTMVTCIAIDSLGHSNSCSFAISVMPDMNPPVIDCMCLENSAHEQLNIVGCKGLVPNLCNYINFACVSDDCCLGECTQTPPAGTMVGPGVTPITFTVKDCAGNSNSCMLSMTVTAPPEGCDPCTNKWNFLTVTTTATNGTFTGANGFITAATTGGPFLGLNNTAYASQFPNLFAASGVVTGYLAQVDLNGSLIATFDLSNYALSPSTVFGIWNITEETDTYSIQVYDCTNNPIAPPFGSTFAFMGWDDDSLAGNIGWYHMTLNLTSGLLSTAQFNSGGTDCDAAFWTNLPPNACKIVVTRMHGDADGVVFYFAEPDPCCRITCPTNITVTTCSTNAVVFYPNPTLSGMCSPGATVICTPTNGSTFPLGTNTVTCFIDDGSGVGGDSCEFTVTVLQQAQPWTVICPDPASSINVTGCPPVMPNLSNLVTIITNCPLPCPITVSQSIPPGTVLAAGTYVPILNVCYCGTNCVICDVTVHAYATGGNPTIKCPPDQVIVTCSNSAVASYKVTASGHNGPISCSPPSGSTLPLGTHVVTCTATNNCGGIATCYFTITVKQPLTRWPCGWQVGIGIPFEKVGGATTALRAIGPGSPAVCIFPNPLNPHSGVLLHLGQAQAITFTTVLDFTAAQGSGIDLVLPPNSMNTNDTPILSFRSKGPKGYCVKTNKRFADDPTGLFRTIAVNTNGHMLDSFTFNSAEAKTNDTLVIGFQPGVTNCHVTVELNCIDGSMSIEFTGPVSLSAMRKGWDGCIYGPDRPVKKPTSRVLVTPPVSPGQPPITELYLYASGQPEVGIEEPTITASGRKWGDGHVTLMKAYDDGDSMEFAAFANDGGVLVDLGHSESFDLRLTKFETNDIPGEQLLTRTIGPIALTNRPSPPPFLDAMLLQASSMGVDCSADFNNIDSPTVRILIYNNGMLVTERSGVPAQLGQTLFTLPAWPNRLGKLGGATPCRRGKFPLGSIVLPGGGGLPPTVVEGDEFRVLAELAPGAPHPDFYSGFEFIASEGADWGITELQRTLACSSAPLNIARTSGGVSLTWSGEGFRLQGAEQVTGPWFDLGVDSSAVIPSSAVARFFRLLCD